MLTALQPPHLTWLDGGEKRREEGSASFNLATYLLRHNMGFCASCVTNTQLHCSAAGPRILLCGTKCVPGKQKAEILNEELMTMRSFPACCPFKFSFHGNRSGEAAWREPGEISAWPPFPLGCQLSHPNCQAFAEVFAIVIYAWKRSSSSSSVPFLRSPKVVSHAAVACKLSSSPSIFHPTEYKLL